jgi:hypothetical protein
MVLIETLKKLLGDNYKSRPGELNLIGVRNTADAQSNKFNDMIIAIWVDEQTDRERILVCDATTDPGVYYRENPLNLEGTGILPAGFYPKLWQLGRHQGKYDALVQLSPVKLWRDNNKDANIDVKLISKPGMYGINLHRANADIKSELVHKWSAGCQVVADPKEFTQLMYLARRHFAKYDNAFDYLLITDRDIT